MIDRVVLVTKPSRLEELARRHASSVDAARFAVESAGEDFSVYEREDEAFRAALEAVRHQVPSSLPLVELSVPLTGLPDGLLRERDLVVVVGVDGLFANVARSAFGNPDGNPIVGVNPDPASVAGDLVRFASHQVGAAIEALISGKAREERLPIAKVSLQNGKTLWGFNDIFLGRADHVSARYRIRHDDREENQSSSGVIVSTGAGATGWLKSIAAQMTALNGGRPHSLSRLPTRLSEELTFVVREPFPSPKTGTAIVTGKVFVESTLRLVSQMAEGGCIFSDGLIERKLDWPTGSVATVTVGERFARAIVPV